MRKIDIRKCLGQFHFPFSAAAAKNNGIAIFYQPDRIALLIDADERLE
jgi:hypothetical protein